MTHPTRPISEARTAFERLLLDAARAEAPDAALEQRMLAPLALSPAATLSVLSGEAPRASNGNGATQGPGTAGPSTGAASTGAASTGAGNWAVWGKWGLALVSGGLLWLAVSSGSNAANPSPRTATKEREPSTALQPHSPQAAEENTAPAVQVPWEKLTSGGSAPAKQLVTRGVSPPLHDELQLLERVRETLAQGRADNALSLLALYDKRYPIGQLRQEATVLRVQALEARGQSKKANALAVDFLEKNPDSAHAPRVARESGLSEKGAPQPK